MILQWPALEMWASRPGRKLLSFDFDGTLAPNVTSPNAPTGLPPPIAESLRTLARNPNVQVAVISGRGFPTLFELVGFRDNIIFAGNHGVEIYGENLQFIEPTVARIKPELDHCLAVLKKELKHIPKLDIEEKTYSGAVFYKNTPLEYHEEIQRITEPILEQFKEIHSLKTYGVYEVCGATPWHKGYAAQWIAEQCKITPENIFFAGDEVNDEPAFAQLTEGFTLKVGPQLTKAKHAIPEQALMQRVLKTFIEKISG